MEVSSPIFFAHTKNALCILTCYYSFALGLEVLEQDALYVSDAQFRLNQLHDLVPVL
jgi:hypothetical protein